MPALLNMVRTGLSRLTGPQTKSFLSKFNTMFGSTAKKADDVVATIKKRGFKKEDVLTLANLLGQGTLAYALIDGSESDVKALASAESKVYTSTDFSNAIKEVIATLPSLVDPKTLQAATEGVLSIMDGNISNNDGTSGRSPEDVAIEVSAQKAAFGIYESVRASKARGSIAIVREMEAKLDRAASILGIGRSSVIELAGLLRDIDGSYEELL